MPELKLRLHEVTEGLRSALERAEMEGGVLSPDLEAELDGLTMAFEPKAEGLAAVVRELEGNAELARDEAERLSLRARSFEAAAKRLKGYVLGSFLAAGYARLKTARFTIWRQKTAAKFAWVGEGAVPEGFRKVAIVLEGEDAYAAYRAGAFEGLPCRAEVLLDHAAAREAHKAGLLPEGFEVSQTEFLRIA